MHIHFNHENNNKISTFIVLFAKKTINVVIVYICYIKNVQRKIWVISHNPYTLLFLFFKVLKKIQCHAIHVHIFLKMTLKSE